MKEVKKDVLVAVVKNKRDLNILLKNRWYRIPVEFLPKRKFKYLAFYEPSGVAINAKRIRYYAKINKTKFLKRALLLPAEASHPNAQNKYAKFEFKEVKRLGKPIKNTIPRRICFGFTSLGKLLSSKNILELYRVPPTQQLIEGVLLQNKIKFKSEFPLSIRGSRFRLDFAILERDKKIAIECDNWKAHRGKRQKMRDKTKDKFLRGAGWRVLRLKEREIISNLEACLNRIKEAVKA